MLKIGGFLQRFFDKHNTPKQTASIKADGRKIVKAAIGRDMQNWIAYQIKAKKARRKARKLAKNQI